jgi:tetratricopeptide (TPR) repeat protein
VQQALARAYRAIGRVRDAVTAFDRAAALEPALAAEARREQAQIEESLARFDAAEGRYAECVRLRPEDATSRRLYGTLLYLRRNQGDRLARATGELERAVALAPEEPAGLVALGHAYEAAGRDAEALLTYRHAIDLAPGAGAPYLDLGRLARRRGRAEEGREMLAMYRLYQGAQREIEGLKAALSARPRDPRVRRDLAEYYFTARDYTRAAAEYERVLALGRALPATEQRGARRRLAEAYTRLARREEAAVQRSLADDSSPRMSADEQ